MLIVNIAACRCVGPTSFLVSLSEWPLMATGQVHLFATDPHCGQAKEGLRLAERRTPRLCSPRPPVAEPECRTWKHFHICDNTNTSYYEPKVRVSPRRRLLLAFRNIRSQG